MKRTANEISRYNKDMANSKSQVTKEKPKVSLQKQTIMPLSIPWREGSGQDPSVWVMKRGFV